MTEEAIAERRKTIVAHAAGIIAHAGVEGCSFGAVSDSTGFSIGMIQHYFRTRERLVLATVEFRTNASVQEWQGLYSEGTNALERLHDLLTFAVEGEATFEEAWGFWVEVYSAAHKDDGIRRHVADALLAWRGIFVQTLEEAVSEGLIHPFHDAEALATLLLAVIDGLAIQTLNGIYDHSPQTMIETLQRFAAHEFGIDEADFVHRKRGSRPPVP
ncbi:TetR family transcriptional regulator C-terminal domain-containing protein [Specibacter cremeus]|uniref:TetR family transcriptional regulator C-terminal domain-containing protein n=1 Tax=Specibacter cremeus TaxID=1629051 RepID=UPI0013DD9788|nr:TetR family transcriptional regulator C-terminal domain-containing protein [Specibacter cremeus]